MATTMAKEFWHSWGQLTVLVLTACVATGATLQVLKHNQDATVENKESIIKHADQQRKDMADFRERLRMLESNQGKLVSMHQLYSTMTNDIKSNIQIVTSVMSDMKADIASMKAHIETLEASE